jgi:hypothetical protein
MEYGIILPLLGGLLAAFGVENGGLTWLAAWLGGDFVILGIAHMVGAHRVFGKRVDGTLPLWSWLVFLPCFALSLVLLRLPRIFFSEPAWHIVTPRLVVGRRLSPSEVQGEFANYVDLTAEFAEPSPIRRLPGYRSLAILDGSAPKAEDLLSSTRRLRPGRTFVHCAQGHGRTGLFAVAALIEWGEASTVEEALRLLQAARPGIRLNRKQARCAKAFAQLRATRR